MAKKGGGQVAHAAAPAAAAPYCAYRDGFTSRVPADVAGARIAQLRQANGGHITPEEILEDARDPASPLHAHFEWKDAVAAEHYRREQARALITAIRVVVTVVNEHPVAREQKKIENIRVVHPTEGRCYVQLDDALNDSAQRQQLVEEARKRYRIMMAMNKHLSPELDDLHAAMRQYL
jgi:hypothetical protein